MSALAAPGQSESGGDPLWSPPLRQAIAAAIDREAMIEDAFAGSATPAYHMVPPGYPFATEPFRERYGRRDLERSRRLLRELGYTPKNPFRFQLWHPPIGHYGSDDGRVWEGLKRQLQDTGLIEMTLASKPWSEYVESFLAGELPAFVIGWSPDFVDPENWLSPFASATQSPDQGVNFFHAELSEVLHRASSSSDPEERRSLYERAGRLYAEEVPTLPLYWEPAVIAYRKDVEGVTIGAPYELNYHVLSFALDATPAAGSRDTLILGKTFPVQSLDATDAHARNDWEILKNTGESLVSYRPGTAELVPGVAELPRVAAGGRSYVFRLRPGMRFADGTPLTAESFLHSWQRCLTLRGQVSSLVRIYVEDVEVADERTVLYHLKDRFGFFPAVAATPAFVPVHPQQFPLGRIVRFPARLDGVGRYRMVSHEPGRQMLLEANELCGLEPKPKIPRILIRYFRDSAALADALARGEIDVAWRKLGAKEAQPLMTRADLEVKMVSTPLLRYLVFNNAFTVQA